MADALGIAGIAGGLHSLFSYNRENFFFDREMRQKQEFQILAFRNKQAELWRDDIRDIIGMTEKKMDSYLVIATLQLGMCVGLFCEGRLEPGTPPWLLAFYMLALGGAFMYLLMAVWFAMHASVVANCSSVRLLTQFVRLPVPTWEHLEDLRTYASAYESVDWQHMLRIPFTGKRGTVKAADSGDAAEARDIHEASAASGSTDTSDPPVADPWGLERHGHRRDLYELEEKHPALRAHVGLARKASLQYQCFDAYARVAMTFGTNQLLNAVGYYCIGYLAVQDGAIWPAWCIVLIMVSIMTTLINVDISLTPRERCLATCLQFVGPVICAAATSVWVFQRHHFDSQLVYLLPVAYAAHALWLLWVLGVIGIERQPNGTVLPTKFRAVLYLDVFGWLNGQHLQQEGSSLESQEDPSSEGKEEGRGGGLGAQDGSDLPGMEPQKFSGALSEGRFGPSTIAFGDGTGTGTSPSTACGSDSSQAPRSPRRRGEEDGRGIDLMTSAKIGDQKAKGQPQLPVKPQAQSQKSKSDLLGAASDLGTPVMNAFKWMDDDSVTTPLIESHDGIGTETPRDPSAPSRTGPRATHTVRLPPKHVFDPRSYGLGPKSVTECPENEAIVSGQENMSAGRLPARVFRSGTFVVALLWLLGLAYPIPTIRELMNTPALSEVFVEEEGHVPGRGWEELEVPGTIGTDPNGLPMFIPLPQKEIPKLEDGELIEVEWPTHAGFFPRSISSDDEGNRLVVADDIGLYATELTRLDPSDAPEADTGTDGSKGRRLRHGHPEAEKRPPLLARFTRVDRCAALEGQALKDMSVVCTSTADSRSVCRVMVLLASGPTLAECRLPPTLNSTKELTSAPSGNVTVPKNHILRNNTWLIAHDWLHKEHHERLDAMAVKSNCLHVTNQKNDANKCIFAAESVGCVVVGTSSGRILQMRGDMEEDGRLVPDMTIHKRPSPVTHGSLHVLPSGNIVALSRKVRLKEDSDVKYRKVKATALAFDGVEGDLLGQWELPKGIDWLTLSGGGDHLLALGLRDQRDLQLYRFPVPHQLRVH